MNWNQQRTAFMPELRWLETHLESMDEAQNLIEEFC
jgi:hypothetical protein